MDGIGENIFLDLRIFLEILLGGENLADLVLSNDGLLFKRDCVFVYGLWR